MSKSRTSRLVLITLACLLLGTLSFSWWANNRTQRPSVISGLWLCDDLRVENDQLSEMVFSPFGEVTGADDDASIHWTYDGKAVCFQHWSNDSQAGWLRWLRGTSVYGWAVDAETFPLTVEFNEDRTIMTLSAELGPRLRLYRPGFEPRVEQR